VVEGDDKNPEQDAETARYIPRFTLDDGPITEVHALPA